MLVCIEDTKIKQDNVKYLFEITEKLKWDIIKLFSVVLQFITVILPYIAMFSVLLTLFLECSFVFLKE